MKQIQDGAKVIASPFIADNQARIKRIIFLELWEVPKIQTTPKSYQHSHFQIYPLGYKQLNLVPKGTVLGLVDFW